MNIKRKEKNKIVAPLGELDPGELFEFPESDDVDTRSEGICMVVASMLSNSPGSKGVKKCITPNKAYVAFVELTSGQVAYDKGTSDVRILNGSLCMED